MRAILNLINPSNLSQLRPVPIEKARQKRVQIARVSTAKPCQKKLPCWDGLAVQVLQGELLGYLSIAVNASFTFC